MENRRCCSNFNFHLVPIKHPEVPISAAFSGKVVRKNDSTRCFEVLTTDPYFPVEQE